MPTLNQLIRKNRQNKRKKIDLLALQSCPQKKGTCAKIYIRTPKKPNSALRKVARVVLTNKKVITAYIPGISHSLQEHAVVLVKGGRTPDLPGIKYRLVRGAYDFVGVVGRKQGRSKYGTKRNNKATK